jgi:5-methylthioadenosine/S-adenosylhomocysteine deaminase
MSGPGQPYDLGVLCGHFMPVRKGEDVAVERDVFVGVRDGIIVSVEPVSEMHRRDCSKTLIDARDKLVMPGLVNAHTHLPMTLFRGLGDDASLHDWLHKTIFPLEAKVISAETARLGTGLALLESIRFGTTTLADMYFFEECIAETLDAAGLRAFVSVGFLDFPTPDNKACDDSGVRALQRLCERYAGHPRIRPAVAAHAPYTCSDATITKCLSLARSADIPFHIHVAETEWEVQNQMAEHGRSPVRRLHDLGATGESSLFAHCVHLSDEDISILADSGTAVVHNPESNMKLGSGIAPVVKLRNAGVRLALGTDGAASNNNLNLFGEMDAAAKLQKLHAHDSSAMRASDAIYMATMGGAEAIGLGGVTGSLEIGKAADLIVVGLDHPHMQPLHSMASQIVYAATGHEVETVVCGGEILFHEGLYRTLDRKGILDEIRLWMKGMGGA